MSPINTTANITLSAYLQSFKYFQKIQSDIRKDVEVDFGVLMSCDHSIISSGTFGWWTAYLTKGTSIYFKGFPSSPLLGCISPPDYYPSHWIGLE
ncbi:galactoside 2-alpha-L-fucosyltransferase Sec1-like [Patella vulgata]|uniref:galactoside 2-alpha-L-fucosyltransferase Sec1-like n=1 Tax=Patella vulgata TaxID=6465 RepID=UPI0021800C64|nr:galactoside 2-alpha-L-fucosyltransferase Sec1-like [Patella vulgata]